MEDRQTLMQPFKANFNGQGQDYEHNFLPNLDFPYPKNEKIDQVN